MRARSIQLDSFEDRPHLADLMLPELQPDQVLVAIRAASINAFDWKVADGRLRDAFEYDFPITLGRDYSGIVAAVGSAVTRVKPGDAVFGYTTGQKLHRGSFATHILLGDGECFTIVPEGVAHEVAASLPLCGVMALRCVSAVEPLAGSKVLIVGAPGGAGSFAVQLAAAKGAHVIATGLADDREYLTGLGAAEIVEPGEALASQVRERHPDGIDALIDLVSYRPAFLRHAGLLRQGGAAASVHRSADDEALGELGLRGVNVNSAPDRALLEELAAQAVTGALQVSIAFRYPLAFTVQGLEDGKELHSRGKRVVVLDQDEQAPS